MRCSGKPWPSAFSMAEMIPEGAIAAAAGQNAAGLWLSHQAEYMARLPPCRYVIPCKFVQIIAHLCLNSVILPTSHSDLPAYPCILILNPMQKPDQKLTAAVVSDSATGLWKTLV